MKTNCIFFSFLVASLSATTAHATNLKIGTICAGAATLDNGSIVTIGQPFVGVMSASDGSASVSSGLLPTLLLSPSSGSPLLINPTFTMQNGRFQFDFPTQPGRNYVVQASTNLLDWTPVWTNIGTWTGLFFQEADSTFFPERFYRVTTP